MEVTRDYILRLIKERQKSQSLRQFALSLGVSAAYLSDVYLGKRDIGPRILSRFGFRKEKSSTITYFKVK
jgi:hypothetical protein